MEERCEGENNSKVDDVMLPGFRFHPTDEELVGFYLRRKIQGRALPIELIKQVDIYKFDPWDLPKFATTGEKEWYFYCPRDRKYRNSARPNRVTGAGFWKATGTDRPIYSSEGTKCIGLKKSLVFYRGRAAKGIKTDWMMHEFRLPSVAPDSNPHKKKFFDRNIPPNDSWAICRIFKKASSMAQQRALSHHWAPQFPEPFGSDPISQGGHCTTQFSSETMSCTTDIGSVIQPGNGSNHDLQNSNTYFSTIDFHQYKPNVPNVSKPSSLPVSNGEIPNNFFLSPIGIPTIIADVSKASENIDFEEPHQFMGGFSIGEETTAAKNSDETGIRSMGFPFSLPMNMPWDSPPSTGFSTNKCYT